MRELKSCIGLERDIVPVKLEFNVAHLLGTEKAHGVGQKSVEKKKEMGLRVRAKHQVLVDIRRRSKLTEV